MRAKYHRQNAINRLRAQLEATGLPRLQMLLIVGLTGGAGFLASYLMLRCCVTSMAVRYPIAIAVAYLVFLFLLWLWLRTSPDDYVNLTDCPSGQLPCSESTAGCADPTSAPDDGGAISDAIEATAGADEFAIPLLVLLVVGALLLSSLWVVYSAPTLFAELLLDGVLSASLYRKLRGFETQHWLTTAVRRTILPFALTAIVVSLGGMALQAHAPTAHSIGEAVQYQGN